MGREPRNSKDGVHQTLNVRQRGGGVDQYPAAAVVSARQVDVSRRPDWIRPIPPPKEVSVTEHAQRWTSRHGV